MPSLVAVAERSNSASLRTCPSDPNITDDLDHSPYVVGDHYTADNKKSETETAPKTHLQLLFQRRYTYLADEVYLLWHMKYIFSEKPVVLPCIKSSGTVGIFPRTTRHAVPRLLHVPWIPICRHVLFCRLYMMPTCIVPMHPTGTKRRIAQPYT